MKLATLQFLMVSLLGLATGCSGGGPQVIMDASVPFYHQASLRKDLQRIGSLNIDYVARYDLQVIGAPAIQGDILTQWIGSRVRLVLGESFNYQAQESQIQLQGNVMPQLIADNDGLVTVMLNVGTLTYLTGKQSNSEYVLHTAEGQFRVSSPRVGIIQEGQGLFDSNQIPGSDVDSEANSLIRIAVLFHEARHGDGNGANAGLPHANCVTGDYVGDSICEGNLNGPYAVQAMLLRYFYQYCGGNCSPVEQQAILLNQADYQSRIQPGAVFADDRPEGLP